MGRTGKLKFTPAGLPGAWLVDLRPHEDVRGFFARTWCAREFEEQGLESRLVQCSLSLSRRRGTLRGMHWQDPPHAEAKLVRCVRGAVHDVILDLREGSPSFGEHLAVRLTAESRRALYVPEGFAHGFQTLEDDTEVFYQMSEFYAPESARGLRWNDPAFDLEWPLPDPILSEKDASWPDYRPKGGA